MKYVRRYIINSNWLSCWYYNWLFNFKIFYAKRMKIIPQVPQPIEIWFYKLFQFLIVYFFNFFPIGKAFDVIKTSTYHLFF